jgi:branched-chain amino acid transport system permease protein
MMDAGSLGADRDLVDVIGAGSGLGAGRVARRHVAAIAAAAVGLVAAPLVLAEFPLSVLTLALAYGLFAFSLDLAWGRTGVFSIGHAAFFGLGAYAVAIASDRAFSGVVAAAAAVVGAALVGYLVAGAGLRAKAVASTMAVLTMALTLLAAQVALSWLSVTNGSNGLFVTAVDVIPQYYTTAAIVFTTTLAVWLIVLRGRLGRRFLAVRVNEVRAEHLGINPVSTRTIAFVLSAAIAALAGAVAAPSMGLISPEVAGIGMSTQVLVWLAVGGRATVSGAFLGAGLLTFGQQYASREIGDWYLFVLGAAFIVVVRLAPAGIVGSLLGPVTKLRSSLAAQGAFFDGRERRIADPPAPPAPAARGQALSIRNVTKSFGALPVIRDVSLDVPAGQIVCLIGPNGAGKTTLLNVVAGDLEAAHGWIVISGEDATAWPPHRRAKLGLGRLFQIPSLFLELTPRQNMLLARAEGRRRVDLPPALSRFADDDARPASELSLADRRSLELAMVLAWGPDVLLLDEPAAGLSHEDSIRLAQNLRDLAQTSGYTLVIVEHDMEIVRELAHRVVVLANGRLLVDGSMDDVTENEDVRRAYLGAV